MTINEEIGAAYRRGQFDILRHVAMLPTPIRSVACNEAGTERLVCDWCNARWTRMREKSPNVHHPDNACLYVSAFQTREWAKPEGSGR